MDRERHSSSQETGLEEITEAELHHMFNFDDRLDLHTAMPCKVVSVTGRTVEVEPGLNRSVPDGAGNYITEPLPNLKGVPIGDLVAGGMIFTLPVQAGDYGILIFCERNIGTWRATGNQGDPGDLGMHTLDGAVFYPGLRPDSKTPANASGTNLVLGSDTNGSARIIIKPSGEVDIGAAVSGFVAMAAKVKAWLDAFNTAVSGWTPVANDGGAALKTALSTLISGTPTTNVASTNTKAEG